MTGGEVVRLDFAEWWDLFGAEGVANGQRVRKRQPEGGLIGLGALGGIRRLRRKRGLAIGATERGTLVYGSSGLA
ncbi:MAG: hypothetical protein QOF01_3423 [Thermomicrobiales bacterium]|jgi:hypothetical protein|nr:hypothetical protein [Thermomicrobiales bacterium]